MIAGLSSVESPGRMAGPAALQAPVSPGAGTSFEEALSQAIGSAVGALQSGEAAAIQGVEGAAAPMTVVESVMGAQRALQSVLAIRDKVVSAWQEVARMAI
jgi:flagellar hook-basal body complex protein FliE